jgi:hypothetical protein
LPRSSSSNELQAKPEQVRALVEEAAQSYEHPEEVVRWYYAQRERLGDFESAAIEANVVDWMLASVKVVDKPVAFGELMGQSDDPEHARYSQAEERNGHRPWQQLGSAGAGSGPDGDRAERSWRTRLRHLLAPAQGARHLPGRSGQ